MKKTDLHNHTEYSFDSTIKMEESIKTAIMKNIDIFGFSDHLDFANNDPGAYYYKPDKQFAEFEKLKKKYNNKIKLLLGIEASYEDYYSDKTKEILSEFDFDYTIMSVHFVNKTVISKWIKEIEENAHNINDIDYSPYFEQMLELIENTKFNILAHIDYYKKYSKFNHINTFNRYIDYYNKIIKALIAKDSILEINTSGLRYDCKEIFPAINILKLYKKNGGEFISIGSDSHTIEQIGFANKEAYRIMKYLGLKQINIGG